MNEFQAALGLLQLKYVDEAIEQRRRIALRYRDQLRGIPGIAYLDDLPGVHHCYPYFPILIEEVQYGKSRDRLYEELKRRRVFCRRYFYPLISQFPAYRGLESAQPGRMPVAERVARQVICLPIYPGLQADHIDMVADTIRCVSKES
jgi:dTDP-4-amino-4,6-dideoxygalactose transaminase